MNWRKQAVVAYDRGDREEAARLFILALEADASGSTARDLAIVHCELGRFESAVDVLRPHLSRQPGDVLGWCALSNALLEQNLSAEALEAARQAIALSPASWIALVALANAQIDLGAFTEASQALQSATLAAPTQPEPLVNQSALYARTQRVDDAIATAAKAIELAPNDAGAHVNLALAYLLNGDYARGFAEYEWRMRNPARASLYDRTPLALWGGSPLRNGTLLVSIEQGLGDFICFSRLLPQARQRVKRLVCEVPEPLLDLYRNFEGIDAVRAPEERADDSHDDAFIPIASLPHALNISTDCTIPSRPYVHANRELVQSFSQRFAALGKPRTVGLVWSGNPTYRMDRHRSLQISELAALDGFEDIAWISLQKGTAEESVDVLPFRVHRFGSTFSNFAGTAAAIEALDLVITVDTAVAHLAGALGKPVWTIIGFAQHWLWQLNRTETPWYPTMRLFRQQTPNQWKDVIAQIATALRQTRVT